MKKLSLFPPISLIISFSFFSYFFQLQIVLTESTKDVKLEVWVIINFGVKLSFWYHSQT